MDSMEKIPNSKSSRLAFPKTLKPNWWKNSVKEDFLIAIESL